LALDASQSTGKVPINIEQSHIDIVAFTGHKPLLGPTGIGGLYVREGIDIKKLSGFKRRNNRVHD
jgi:cysteine desulfurase/selenocysteine lyase